jgi:hypothetical protein
MSNKKFAMLIGLMALGISGGNMVQPLVGTIAMAFVGGMGFIYIRSVEDDDAS